MTIEGTGQKTQIMAQLSKPVFFTCLILALMTIETKAQYFTNSFDFQRINTKTFTVNTGTGNLQKHINSSIYTCTQLADLAQNGAWNESRIIGLVASNTKLKATKLSYTPFDVQVGSQAFKLRLIYVRPNDNVNRPCVLLSPGTDADFNHWYNYMVLGVADYVSKGYAVAFYENWNNRYVKEAVQTNTNASTNLPIGGDPELPFYGLYQFANAAAKYVVGNATALKINQELLFAGGNSAGGFSAYALALADENNFEHPVFEVLGGRDSKAMPEFANHSYSIKAIGILGSGLFQPSAKMGDLVDESDSDLRAVLWHGALDPEIHLYCCADTPCDANNSLSICGAIEVGERLCDIGAVAKVHVNCLGEHLVMTQQYVPGLDNALPTASAILGPIRREVQQLMTIQLKITEVFQKITIGNTSGSCSLNFWKPKGYPNPFNNDWHLGNSSACNMGVVNLVEDRDEGDGEPSTNTPALTIFPNPVVEGTTTIYFSAPPEAKFEGKAACHLINPTGQYLKTIELFVGYNTLDISNLNPGVYSLQVGCHFEKLVIVR